MKIPQQIKLLMVTLSILVLVGCDQYDFVNTDEYLVIKKDEIKEFNKTITWSELEISVLVDIKYFNESLNYRIKIEDLKGNVITETDYYSRLMGGDLELIFRDTDDFDLVKLKRDVSRFANIENSLGKVDELIFHGSVLLDEDTYYKIENLTIYTYGM